jgi:hypothetical protein
MTSGWMLAAAKSQRPRFNDILASLMGAEGRGRREEMTLEDRVPAFDVLGAPS